MYADKFNLTKKQNVFLAKKLMVENIYNSAKIEGVNVTFPETQTILDGINVPNLGVNELEVILNLRNAWKYLLFHIDDPCDLKFLKYINRELCAGLSIMWGVLRNGKVKISNTKYVPPIPERKTVIEELQRISLIVPPTEQAIQLFLYLVYNQLFWDGNKRTATLCANAVMVRNGAGLLMIPEEKKAEFYKQLKHYYDTGNGDQLSDFLYKYCIAGIEFQKQLDEPEL